LTIQYHTETAELTRSGYYKILWVITPRISTSFEPGFIDIGGIGPSSYPSTSPLIWSYRALCAWNGIQLACLLSAHATLAISVYAACCVMQLV